MAGKKFHGTYNSTVLLTNTVQQNPATLTGSITVSGTNASSDSGFYSNTAFAWSISNQGQITATGVTSYGICLIGAGGTITNGHANGGRGMIRSDETGVLLSGGVGAVTNDGTIIGTAGRGVFLQDGGTLTNAVDGAVIQGGFVGVAIYNAGGSLSNAGTILNTGTAGLAVELYAGSVVNQASGAIGGVYGVGFVAQHVVGTLTNAGSISGSGRDGVELSAGGSVSNTGRITGAIGGVLALGGVAAVTNSGVITGQYAGIDLLMGGAVTNQAGGSITGGFGVSAGNGALAGATGTVVNAGVISAGTYQGVSLNAGGGVTNSGSIYGRAAGVAAFYGSATVANTGVIDGGFIGVKLGAGGVLTNAAGASIAAQYGVVLADGTPVGTLTAGAGLTNAGIITGSGSFGAEVLTNGVFLNQAGGTISGGRYGVYVSSVGGTIANYGVIEGQTGVYGRAVVANGTRYPGAVTIINAGTILGSGGIAVSMFASDDLLVDHPGAVFGGGVVAGGGRLELTAGGSGTLGVLAAAVANFSTITEDAGAVWNVAGTLAAGATLDVGGTLGVSGGAVFLAKGLAQGIGGGVGTVALSHGGTLASVGTLAASLQVRFDDGFGHLTLTSPLSDGAETAGFGPGDTIYLPDIAITGLTESYAGTSAGGTLTLSQGGATVAHLALLGAYSTASFAIAGDPNGGADVMVPCFAAGTAIATPAGPRLVERVRVGDLVMNAAGDARRIVWIGRRRIDVARHADPDSVRPVLIVADAFGPGRPGRDLLLSPDHAVLCGGALIPAHALINHRSVRPGPVGVVRYFHVELPGHDILLAEGLEVESYLDTGNRGLLGEVPAGGMRRGEGVPCAPFALSGPVVARARRHLAVQAAFRHAACGGADDAGDGGNGVTLVAGGRTLAPVGRRGGRLLFLVPAGAGLVAIMAAAPCDLAGVIVDGALLDAAGPAYASGFAAPAVVGRRVVRRVERVACLALTRARVPRSLELIVAPARAAA